MSLTISKGKVCKPDLISVEDQKLKDQNNLNLAKPLVNSIEKINDKTWKVFDSEGNFKTVCADGKKIFCDMTCSHFKWERNRHPNCKHVQAVMLLEKKKFKIEIPVEWEIIFLESHLERESAKATELYNDLERLQKEYDLKTSNILQLQRAIMELKKQ